MIRDLGNIVVDMILFCPACGTQHIDAPSTSCMHDACPRATTCERGECVESWTNPPHRSHLCHGCGHIWRPSDVHTNGVKSIRSRGVNDSPAVRPPVLTPAYGRWERL